jgi:hypothetical protein
LIITKGDEMEETDLEILEACDRWEALMSSGRIRFMGSARLGKEAGQVLCVEFHSDCQDVDERTRKETELAIDKLKQYTSGIMSKPIKKFNLT